MAASFNLLAGQAGGRPATTVVACNTEPAQTPARCDVACSAQLAGSRPAGAHAHLDCQHHQGMDQQQRPAQSKDHQLQLEVRGLRGGVHLKGDTNEKRVGRVIGC
jgi:hypothetical protein